MLRSIPSVDKLINSQPFKNLQVSHGRGFTVDALRITLDIIRTDYIRDQIVLDPDEIFQKTQDLLESWTNISLKPVINATGVIIHTNLGRSPLSVQALNAVQEIGAGYSNLEYDLSTNKRGSRLSHTEDLINRITGAEASMVVNNNASAVLLVLSSLANRRRVLISRSELIEIGGGFRIPDVMKQSGAKLVEIGTTNRVDILDYQEAIANQPIYLVVRAHRSNFQIVGFTSEPDLEEIANVAHENDVPVLYDQGSGLLIDLEPYGLKPELTVQKAIAAGSDLVCFSGDKLVGGPQSGIIVGKESIIKKLKKHPLARAIRADKLVLASLSATLMHFLKGEADDKIPIWQMISARVSDIEATANKWKLDIGTGKIIPGESTIGGGSLPGETLPTCLLSLEVRNPKGFLSKLTMSNVPIIGRIKDDRVVLDPRTVLPDQETDLISSIKETLMGEL